VWRIYQNQLYITGFTNGGCGVLGGEVEKKKKKRGEKGRKKGRKGAELIYYVI
jgi:uncharacterized membrane protein YsdA (DUF1294 family)